jgi:DNA recombination protein RmuC
VVSSLRLRGNEESLGGFRQAIETRLASFESQNTRNLEQVRSEAAANAQSMRTETGDALKAFNDSLLKNTAEVAKVQAGQLAGVAESVDKKLEAMRSTVDAGLKTLQEENSKKLEQMRQTANSCKARSKSVWANLSAWSANGSNRSTRGWAKCRALLQASAI